MEPVWPEKVIFRFGRCKSAASPANGGSPRALFLPWLPGSEPAGDEADKDEKQQPDTDQKDAELPVTRDDGDQSNKKITALATCPPIGS
jgi:hypothetical protein